MNGEVYKFILPHIEKNNVEIEFRLGKKNGSYFDTNVGKERFEKLYRRLLKYPGWESVKKQSACVFYGRRKNLRVVYDEVTEEQTCVCKYNVENKDFILKESLDVRVSVSIENPATYDSEKDQFILEVKRDRTSFIRKGLSIDLSIVENEDKDSEEKLVYRVELEIVEDLKQLDMTKITNHFQKVFDIMKLLV